MQARVFDRLTERNDPDAMKELVDYLGFARFGDEAKKVLEETSFEIDSSSHLAHRLRVLNLHEMVNELERCDATQKPAVRQRIKEKFDDLQMLLSSRYNPKSVAEDGSASNKTTWLDMQIEISREAVLSILASEYRAGQPFNPDTVAAFKDAVNKAFPAYEGDSSVAAADPAHRQLEQERKQLLDVVLPTNVVDEMALGKQLQQLSAFPNALRGFLDMLEESTIPLPEIIVRRESVKNPPMMPQQPFNGAWNLGNVFPAGTPFPGMPTDPNIAAAAALYAAGAGGLPQVPPPQQQPAVMHHAKPKRKSNVDYDSEYTDDDTKRKKAAKKRRPVTPSDSRAPGGLEGAPDVGNLGMPMGMAGAAPIPAPPSTPVGDANGANARVRSSSGRKRVRFTAIEEDNLKRGVEEFGVGKWEEIRRKYWFNERTNVDLKDKWRNMSKKHEKAQREERARIESEQQQAMQMGGLPPPQI